MYIGIHKNYLSKTLTNRFDKFSFCNFALTTDLASLPLASYYSSDLAVANIIIAHLCLRNT